MGDPWKSISPEGVRAFTYGSLSVLLLWGYGENYLLPVNDILMMLGISDLLAKSLMISSVIFILIIFITIIIFTNQSSCKKCLQSGSKCLAIPPSENLF